MTGELVSPNVFHWILIVLTGGLAGTWLVYDTYSLIRSHGADRRDPSVGDKRFGYMMGVIIGAIGVIGCLRYHYQFVS